MEKLKYSRVMLKLSGEALAGHQQFGIEPDAVRTICREIAEVARLGVQIAMVIGGGNIFRGMSDSARGMDRASADYMGMLATVLNALAVQSMLESMDLETRVLSAITMQEVCEPYIRRRAVRHLEKNRVVICAAGTGNPYFTTDTAAALRSMELRCEAIFKATKVEGVFDADPATNPDATFYKTLTHIECLEKRLKVMDSTAISLAMDNRLPIVVFNLFTPGNIRKVLTGEDIGTVVSGG